MKIQTLRNYFLKTAEKYAQLFSIHEIDHNEQLQWSLGALLLIMYASFSSWALRLGGTVESINTPAGVCWPFFQNCNNWYFLHTLPFGYSQTTIYMGFYGLLCLGVYFIWKKQFAGAHFVLLLTLIWKIFIIFSSLPISGPYDYYDLIFLIIILLLPHKLFFAQLIFILFYFLAATIKIHAGWIVGTYFTALVTGLPWIPDTLAPLATNIIIGMQIVGAWFLLSTKRHLRITALSFFVFFHLYSGILVLYRYPTSALPFILIFFGPMFKKIPIPLDKKSLYGWSLILVMCICQSIPFLIKGDQKMTLEGNEYGLYMFEANHQCISTVKLPNEEKPKVTNSSSAWTRCDPYRYFFQLIEKCEKNPEREIPWTFDHSINGGPFYRIVDTNNACGLTYKAFSKNDWIESDLSKAKMIGIPVKNRYQY